MKDKKKNIWQKMEEAPIIENIVGFLKAYALPGFQGVSIYTVLSFVYDECMKDDVLTRANSVAFSIFLSLFPSIIFVFTLLPMFPVTADYLGLLRETTAEILPKEAHNYLFSIVEDVVSIKREGLLSLGFLLALFFSSTGMMDLMNGFEKSYAHAFKKRNYFKKRLIAILLIMVHIVILLSTLMIQIYGTQLINNFTEFLPGEWIANFVLQLGKYMTMFFLLYLAITTIYRYGPSLRIRISWVNPGAILATIFSILISIVFTTFINNFGRYNELYGSIGALLVFLLWLMINALIILIGFELNASIAVNRIIPDSTQNRDAQKVKSLNEKA